MSSIADNLEKVRDRIDNAAHACGRTADGITLLAVSKTRPVSDLKTAIAAGARHFGENYVQEALEKIEALASEPDLVWHFIGPIQSNKTRDIAAHFDWVHSVDRLKIARRLSDQRGDRSPLNVCIQVNTDAEASKAGVDLDAVPALAADVAGLPGIALRGLMAIPDPSNPPEVQQQRFRSLARLLAELRERHPEQPLDTLSMGMSGDLEDAVAAGATIVRIGTAIFGPRDTGAA